MPRVIPEGSPFWERTAQIGDYGGHVAKQDYGGRKPLDPLTDVGASQFARMTADLTAVAHVAPVAVVTVRLTPSGVPPCVEFVHMATGVRLIAYDGDNAPVGYPIVTRNGTSDISVTFAPSYADAYGVFGAFSLTHAKVGAVYQSVARVVAEIVSPTVLRVRAFDAADAPITEALPPHLRDPIEERVEVPADGVLRVSLIVW